MAQEEEEKKFLEISAFGIRYDNILWDELREEEVIKRFKEYEKLHKIVTSEPSSTYYVTGYIPKQGGVEIDPVTIIVWHTGNGVYLYPAKWKRGAKLFIPYSKILYIEDPEESSPYTSIGIALLLGSLVGLPVAISILGNLMKTEG